MGELELLLLFGHDFDCNFVAGVAIDTFVHSGVVTLADLATKLVVGVKLAGDGPLEGGCPEVEQGDIMLENECDANFGCCADGDGGLWMVDGNSLGFTKCGGGKRFTAVVLLGVDVENASLETDQTAPHSEQLGLDAQ